MRFRIMFGIGLALLQFSSLALADSLVEETQTFLKAHQARLHEEIVEIQEKLGRFKKSSDAKPWQLDSEKTKLSMKEKRLKLINLALSPSGQQRISKFYEYSSKYGDPNPLNIKDIAQLFGEVRNLPEEFRLTNRDCETGQLIADRNPNVDVARKNISFGTTDTRLDQLANNLGTVKSDRAIQNFLRFFQHPCEDQNGVWVLHFDQAFGSTQALQKLIERKNGKEHTEQRSHYLTSPLPSASGLNCSKEPAACSLLRRQGISIATNTPIKKEVSLVDFSSRPLLQEGKTCVSNAFATQINWQKLPPWPDLPEVLAVIDEGSPQMKWRPTKWGEEVPLPVLEKLYFQSNLNTPYVRELKNRNKDRWRQYLQCELRNQPIYSDKHEMENLTKLSGKNLRWEYVKTKNPEVLRRLLDSGKPLTAFVSTEARAHYEDWIKPEDGALGHAIVIVGYGKGKSAIDARETPYFEIRDSFGASAITYKISETDLSSILTDIRFVGK